MTLPKKVQIKLDFSDRPPPLDITGTVLIAGEVTSVSFMDDPLFSISNLLKSADVASSLRRATYPIHFRSFRFSSMLRQYEPRPRGTRFVASNPTLVWRSYFPSRCVELRRAFQDGTVAMKGQNRHKC